MRKEDSNVRFNYDHTVSSKVEYDLARLSLDVAFGANRVGPGDAILQIPRFAMRSNLASSQADVVQLRTIRLSPNSGMPSR